MVYLGMGYPYWQTSPTLVSFKGWLVGWLVVLGFNATLTAKVISWQSVTHYVFPGFLTPVLTQLFFPKPPTTFLTCFCRGDRWKYTGKKSRLNRGSNSQPPGHESDMLTTEPPGWGKVLKADCLRNCNRNPLFLVKLFRYTVWFIMVL